MTLLIISLQLLIHVIFRYLTKKTWPHVLVVFLLSFCYHFILFDLAKPVPNDDPDHACGLPVLGYFVMTFVYYFGYLLFSGTIGLIFWVLKHLIPPFKRV